MNNKFRVQNEIHWLSLFKKLSFLLVYVLYFSSHASADIIQKENSEDELWQKIAGVINLEYGTLSHSKVEEIFEKKLALIKHEGDTYHYLGRLTSGDYFTVLINEQKNGDGSKFIFQWDNKIDVKHAYIDVTSIPSPAGFCINAFDRRGDIKSSDFIGRSHHYLNNQTMIYLGFARTQKLESVDTKIYLDEINDCLLRVEVRNDLPLRPRYIPMPLM